MKELLIKILGILENADYLDPAEHMYDAIKNIKSDIRNKKEADYNIHDFLSSMRSASVHDLDGNIKYCHDLLKEYYVLSNI